MFHCLFIVLKILLFSMPSSQDPVIRMFHCLFIVLKIPTVLNAIQSRSNDENVPMSFDYAIQSRSSDQNVPMSFHCFENPAQNIEVLLVFFR